MMGGEIGVDSQPGVGSTFWFEVWLARRPEDAVPAAAQVADPEQALATRFAGGRILLAEDEPTSQRVASELLGTLGLTVDVAVDGLAAVEMSARNRYDLILMDLQMPGLNGLEATRTIRARPGGDAVPILAMTANTSEQDRERCLAAGMNGHVGKPIEPQRLFETLLKWLTRGESAAGKVV